MVFSLIDTNAQTVARNAVVNPAGNPPYALLEPSWTRFNILSVYQSGMACSGRLWQDSPHSTHEHEAPSTVFRVSTLFLREKIAHPCDNDSIIRDTRVVFCAMKVIY